jgi:hypothetical protein
MKAGDAQSANDPPALAEDELAAATPGLLGQVGLWASLRLPAAGTTDPARQPWLTYWTTRLDEHLDVQLARERHAAAYRAFDLAGDVQGTLLCLAAIIEGFYVDEGTLEPLDSWIQALAERLLAPGLWPSLELEARVMACGVGVRLRDPAHPLLARWAARGPTLLRQLKPGPTRLKVATFLAHHHFWRGEFARAGLIIDAVPGLEVDGLLPDEALMWPARKCQ